jgi:hypothetical protein
MDAIIASFPQAVARGQAAHRVSPLCSRAGPLDPAISCLPRCPCPVLITTRHGLRAPSHRGRYSDVKKTSYSHVKKTSFCKYTLPSFQSPSHRGRYSDPLVKGHVYVLPATCFNPLLMGADIPTSAARPATERTTARIVSIPFSSGQIFRPHDELATKPVETSTFQSPSHRGRYSD